MAVLVRRSPTFFVWRMVWQGRSASGSFAVTGEGDAVAMEITKFRPLLVSSGPRGEATDEAPALSASGFAALARVVADESRALGCSPPGFRSPVRPGSERRVLLRTEYGPVVAVAYRGRMADEVAADLVDGVALVNGLGRRERDNLLERVKGHWWAAQAA